MSLYKEKKINFNIKNKKPILISIGIFLGVILIFLLISLINFDFLTNRDNINIEFSRNPFDISKHQDLDMEIVITNNSEIDATNSIVKIDTVEKIFEVDCSDKEEGIQNSITIPILAKKDKRIINCRIIPTVEFNSILEGTYSFDVSYTLNSIPNQKRTVLEIRK
jgi:hypothetical protein